MMNSKPTPDSGPLPDGSRINASDIATTDQTLMERVQLGCDDAAEALFVRYAERLETLAGRQLADDLRIRVDPDDVVQSVFRTFFRRAARGDYAVPEGEELWGLLLVIGLNKIRAHSAHHRAAKRNVGTTVNFDATHSDIPASDQSEIALLRMVIDELVESLPESHAQIVNLRIEGCDVSGIAERTQRSKRTIERVLQQFRDRLRTAIGGDHERA
ncbi:MAG: sigma-70 family RNA polymerase sigma factor [Planctomycetaceae bacterium]